MRVDFTSYSQLTSSYSFCFDLQQAGLRVYYRDLALKMLMDFVLINLIKLPIMTYDYTYTSPTPTPHPYREARQTRRWTKPTSASSSRASPSMSLPTSWNTSEQPCFPTLLRGGWSSCSWSSCQVRSSQR